MAETDEQSVNTAAPARNDAAQTQDRGTFVPLIFGGAVACALGFFAGQLESVEKALGWGAEETSYAADIAAQSEQISQQSASLTDLSARVDGINVEPPEPVDLTPLEQGIEAQTAKFDELSSQLTAFSERLTDLEQRPMTDALSEEAIAAYQKELADLQASVATQRSEVEQLYEKELETLNASVETQKQEVAALLEEAKATETEAEEEANRALGRAALAKILTAVDAGTPFPDAVADLEASGAAEVPAELAAVASDGTPTLAQLQDSFPAASRAALSVARANAPDSNTVGSFLKRSLGARSVAPKEGDDPDAVLSRAEAAVRQGRIGDALAEIDVLPDTAKATMADWVEAAQTRFSAQQAADALMQNLTTN